MSLGADRVSRGRALLAGAAFLAGAGLLSPACGTDEPELFVRPFDAGSEADVSSERAPEVDPTLGGPCTEDVQCEDQIPCTFDRCDAALARCRNTPDDSACADTSYCNGREVCVLRLGCVPGPVVTCQDGDPCTLDRCIEATKTCEHLPRDLDGDGDPDDHCVGSRDCDDLDPDVSSTRAEVCRNGRDDDCDGQIDEAGCVEPLDDVCATARTITAAGTYLLSTVATRKDYLTSCSVPVASAAKDVVVSITVPGVAGDPPRDVEVWPTTTDPAPNVANVVAVALQTTCGDAATEVACHTVVPSPDTRATSARAIARGVPAGSKIHAVVTTQTEGPVALKVDIRPATAKPTNEACAAPAPVALETPVAVSLIDPVTDLPSDCDRGTGDLTYAFTLDAPRDVRIFASTLAGGGKPVVSLRTPACSSELRCRKGTAPPAFARNLAAGTHVFTVSATDPIDASVLVKTYPVTPAPPNQTCATAPPITPNTALAVDLSAQEDAIDDGCFGGGLSAAYALTLTEPSDVLVVGRFPLNDRGAVSLDREGCTTADVLRCSSPPGPSPQRVSLRNVAPGSYRVVVADELGLTAQLSVYVRPTSAPVNATSSDTCVSPMAIAAAAGGGYYVGDTSAATADFGAGCDAPGQPITTAKDQILRLELTQQRRVVLDMIGSGYQTVLDLRQGPTCPGTEVAGSCFVGFGPNRSFLETVLGAGTYFVQIDGYSAQTGPWNLDVRVLPP